MAVIVCRIVLCLLSSFHKTSWWNVDTICRYKSVKLTFFYFKKSNIWSSCKQSIWTNTEYSNRRFRPHPPYCAMADVSYLPTNNIFLCCCLADRMKVISWEMAWPVHWGGLLLCIVILYCQPVSTGNHSSRVQSGKSQNHSYQWTLVPTGLIMAPGHQYSQLLWELSTANTNEVKIGVCGLHGWK